MLSDKTPSVIKQKINHFLTPELVKDHGRPVYLKDVKKTGFVIEEIDLSSPFWETIYELYVRLNNLVSTNNIGKCIESKKYSYKMPVEG